MIFDIRHDSTEECDGTPSQPIYNTDGTLIAGPWRCTECLVHLCYCETTYGHDCEESDETRAAFEVNS